ncbi:MAG TPA: carboxypeptidase regulatory-like domain-containing protein [bacterium]|jgi:hypothetical protein|nr:carboxypeptidase regulatory-like domain-containing protein [bacterium]
MDLRKVLAFLMAAGLLTLSSGCGNSDDNDDFGKSTGGGSGTASTVSSGAMGTASIAGKVTLSGKAPNADIISYDADPVCKAQHATSGKDETVVADANGDLANVFIYVKDGAGSYSAPTTPVTLLQKGCMYSPHIFGIQVNQPLEIVNGDPTLHNIHCLAVVNDAFNVGQPTQNMATQKTFSKPEVLVKFKCDVHGWMHCTAGVVTNPFYSISGTDGSFKISQLPAGTYTVVAVHEKYGESQPQQITVKDGEAASANFTFAAQ